MDEILKARDPLGRRVPVEFSEDFLPLGAMLRLETNSRAVLDACRTSFGRYGNPDPENLRQDGISLRIIVDPAFNEAPPWPEPRFRGHKDIFYISVGSENTAVAQLDRRSAIGFLSPAMVEDSVFLRNTFLECLVLTLLTHGRRSTHTYAHASAVALGSRGLLFSGPSCSGKSTLAFACARRGFRIVSDDVVYLRDGEHGLVVWGKPWHVRFLSDYARFFPELGDDLAHLRFDGNDCVEIDVDAILPGHTQTQCRPAAVFFLDRDGVGPMLERVDPDHALRLLARELVYDEPEVLDRHRRFWLALIRRGAYMLRCGEDLDPVVEKLRDFLRTSEISRTDP